MSQPHTDVDLLIVGAGMVGSVLAAALAPRMRVMLLDRGPAPRDDAGPGDYDLRVSALGMGSQRVMQAVGAWSAIAARRNG